MHYELQVRRVARIASRHFGLALVVVLLLLASACGAQHGARDHGSSATAGAADDWLHLGASNVRASRLFADFALLRTPVKSLPDGVRKIMSGRFPDMRWNRARPVPT